MSRLADTLRQAQQTIAPVTETPRLDAELLLAHCLGMSRARLLACLHEERSIPDAFEVCISQRLHHEPIAHILGEWEFFSLDFEVAAPLLVPRPETEHLVEAVLEHCGDRFTQVLELGTGTGCVAVSIAVNAARTSVLATDIHPKAVEVAARNAQRHRIRARVRFVQMDLFAGLATGPRFDAICSNPPYVETTAWEGLSPVIRLHEDPGALLAGPDGLDVVRRIVAQAPRYLKPGGLLALEIGMGQYRGVKELLTEYGYRRIRALRDLAGIDRIAAAEAP